MAFDLSFSEEFFFAPGDTEGAPFNRDNPVSLYQAICVFSESEEWPEFYKELFEMEFESPLTEGEVFRVMELARKTDTCTDLSPPVEVWLDKDGDHKVSVYEEINEDNECDINKLWVDKTIEILKELALSVSMVSNWMKGVGEGPMPTAAMFVSIRERQRAIAEALFDLERALEKNTSR